jgi:hypothetical protein
MWARILRPSYPGHAGYPVRRGFPVLSLASLEYWIVIGRRESAKPVAGDNERQSPSVVVARLDRAIQYAAAFRLNTTASGILGRPVKPGNDSWGIWRLRAR